MSLKTFDVKQSRILLSDQTRYKALRIRLEDTSFGNDNYNLIVDFLDLNDDKYEIVEEYLALRESLSLAYKHSIKFTEFELGWDYTGNGRFREKEMQVAIKIKEQLNVNLFRVRSGT